MSAGGFSRARLDRMHDALAGYVERGEVPGLVAAVSRGGETHVEAFGAQAADGGRPVGRDTLFRISSMTKPVTAVATLLLVEECKLRLDEPVDRLLPELADRKVLTRLDAPLDDTVPAQRPITVRDLLTFRMGMGIILAPPDTYPIQRALDELELGQGQPHPATPPAPDEWMRRLGTLPLLGQPGEQWMYNTGADVLSVLIARASGQPFETFLRERLFEPLGMRATSFSAAPEQLDRLTTCYQRNPASGALEVYDEAESGEWSRPPAFPSGAAGLISTIDDYLAFSQMLVNKGAYGASGRERLLSRPMVELMTTNQLTPTQKESLILGDFGWGFGVSIVTHRDTVESIGSFGWSGGLGSLWRADPQERMSAVLLTSRVWESASPPNVCLDFITSAYAAIDD